jgi:hypothetical protein
MLTVLDSCQDPRPTSTTEERCTNSEIRDKRCMKRASRSLHAGCISKGTEEPFNYRRFSASVYWLHMEVRYDHPHRCLHIRWPGRTM